MVRRHVGRHLVYWEPRRWLTVTTVLRPENDPLHPLFDIHDTELVEGGKPYEVAIRTQDREYVTVQKVGPTLADAERVHTEVVAGVSSGELEGWDDPLLVRNIGLTRKDVEQVASDITARLESQEIEGGRG